MEILIPLLGYSLGLLNGYLLFSTDESDPPTEQQQINELRADIQKLVNELSTTKTK